MMEDLEDDLSARKVLPRVGNVLRGGRGKAPKSVVEPEVVVAPKWSQMMQGVQVQFPHKPYGSQIGLMDKVLRCLKNKENGLLESPTGSGKSLALLCSSQAYQMHLIAKAAEARQKQNAMIAEQLAQLEAGVSTTKPGGNQENQSTSFNAAFFSGSGCSANSRWGASPMKTQTSVNGNGAGCSGNQPCCAGDGSLADAGWAAMDVDMDTKLQMLEGMSAAAASTATPEVSIPKIYFCTRTHKQIAQLIRELRKTTYKNCRMTILGSREQYCIHEYVSKHGNKNENCSRLLENAQKHPFQEAMDMSTDADDPLDGQTCDYFGKGRAVSHGQLQNYDLKTAFDIEDLVKSGKKHRFCPYFASRELRDGAQLIFTPYNYLVDAKIRATMQISLDNAIVIFDEGHNMEDAAREAASYILQLDNLKMAIQDLQFTARELSDQAAKYSMDSGEHISPAALYEIVMDLLRVLQPLEGWVEEAADNLEVGINSAANRVITGRDMIAIATRLHLGPKEFPAFKKNVEALYNDKNATEEEQSEYGRIYAGDAGDGPSAKKKVSSAALLLVGSLSVVLDYLYRNDCQHAADYNIVVVKEPISFRSDMEYFRQRKHRRGTAIPQWNITLNFWCLNPAVAFGDFKVCHAVVLTSGTLSPMASFQSELGLEFQVKFEAPHVIEDGQVWAGVIGQGPARTTLCGTYKNVQTLAYQDDLGNAVLQVCQAVPKGVLCFFTSYKAMDTMITRWKLNGIYEALEEKKVVLQEPQRADKNVFAAILETFYQAIRGTGLHEGQDGALMFGVYRGKISEGLDFADDNARAVIAVGIPYPYFQDTQVKMKRQYNDARRNLGLLSGDEWYDIQAFRAINQALGRCLRHKHDWGALILLEQRFMNPKFVDGLSKWVRQRIKRNFRDFADPMNSLRAFVAHRLAMQPVAPPLEERPLQEMLDEQILTDDEDSPLKLKPGPSTISRQLSAPPFVTKSSAPSPPTGERQFNVRKKKRGIY
ncbi:Fanconi anemia group J protein homolog [Paramacrobiotus metropolitanus]|uniref:Fanconi anemia group J protein homolog n=1 Tax=Paramacrobiotus metropolitanus TaxID=2943436 RepID=UPI0024463338|nr:Fanconi anemia group J protein homolog [Paramacrobiotus metropolitanus]